jgi:hypothetical protein
MAERDENTCRKDLLPTEAVALGAAIEAIETKAAKERQGRPEKPRSGKLPEHRKGRVSEKVAKAARPSRRSKGRRRSSGRRWRDRAQARARSGALVASCHKRSRARPGRRSPLPWA